MYVALFLYLAVGLQGTLVGAPNWFPMALTHSGVVGMISDLLFGVYSVRTQATNDILSWGEPAAMWLTNLGLVLFIGLHYLFRTRHGAIVMGVGLARRCNDARQAPRRVSDLRVGASPLPG